MTKKEILEVLTKEQTNVVQTVKDSIAMYKTTSDIDEDNTLDPEDYSHQAEAKEMQMRMEEKLKVEKLMLDFIESHKNNEYSEIKPGALIETDTYYLYVGVSVPPFKVNKKELLCISEKAPILATLKDKKVGDTIKLGTITATILNIS